MVLTTYRLNTLLDCIFDTQTSSNEIRQNVQHILDEQERGFRLKRELSQHRSNLIDSEYRVMQQKKLLTQKTERIKRKKQEIEDRRMDLLDSFHRHDVGVDDLQENEAVLEKNIKMRQTMFHTLNRRKKELIADLFSIYPIEQVRKFSLILPLSLKLYVDVYIKSHMMIRNSFVFAVSTCQIQCMMVRMMK